MCFCGPLCLDPAYPNNAYPNNTNPNNAYPNNAYPNHAYPNSALICSLQAYKRMTERGYRIGNLDVTLILQAPKVPIICHFSTQETAIIMVKMIVIIDD